MQFQILKKAILFSVFVLGLFQISAQVKGVSYDLTYNEETQLFDCSIIIEEGQAVSIRERVQFNSQISVVVPTGSSVELANFYMPIQDNQHYEGTTPMEWRIDKALMSPLASPSKDFHSITPIISPSSFYNNLMQGDKIKLFSLKIESKNKDLVRLFNRAIDPDDTAAGMQGRDFTNSFCIGGPDQDYLGR